MTPAEVLRRARNLIEAGWCRHREAEAADFTLVGFDHPTAVRFDPPAAIMRVAGEAGLSSLGEAAYWSVAAFHKAMLGGSGALGHEHGAFYIDQIALWNNNLDRRLEEVLAAFDAAIAIAEEWQAEVERKLALAQIEDAKNALRNRQATRWPAAARTT